MKTQKQVFLIIVIFIILLSGCDNWTESLNYKSNPQAPAPVYEFWSKMNVPASTDVLYSTRAKGRYFAGTTDGKIYYSIDYGSAWTLAYETGSAINIIGSDQDGSYYMAGNYNGIYLSLGGIGVWSHSLTFTDKDRPAKVNYVLGATYIFGIFGKCNVYLKYGDSWNSYCYSDSGTEIRSRFSKNIGSLYYDYYAVQDSLNAKIFRRSSPDNPRHSDYIDLGSGIEIYNIIFDQDLNKLFVNSNKGLFSSDDMGRSWAISDYSGMDIKNFVIYKNYYYIATEKGLFTSNDKGKNWKAVMLPYQDCSILSFNITADSVIYIQTARNEFFLHWINNDNNKKTASSYINLVPILIFPQNGDIDLEQTVNFRWSDQKESIIVWYFFQVSKDRDFSGNLFADIEWLNPPNYSLSNLSEKTKYYWRVRRGNADTMSLWSEVWSFTTK